MNTIENKLSEYIDRLNAEQKPVEHTEASSSTEYEELMDAVRIIRTVKEPLLPDENFSKKLTADMQRSLAEKRTKAIRKKWLFRTAAAAAVFTAVIVTNILLPNKTTNIASAMEKAYNNIKAYHGVMEVVQMNEFKEESLQAKREVWADKNGNYYVKELEGTSAGLITVNNGTKKWQLDEERKQVSLYSVFPDSYRFTLELGNEIEDIKSAVDIKIIGEDTIAGRAALKLMITPAGGSSYLLWTDKETNLPLQKETPMQNSIGYRITYTDIDFMDAIPEEQMNYYAPSDYEVVNTNDEQIVNNLEEAKALIGFTPAIISQIPEDYQLDTISISNGNSNANFYYTNGKNTIIFSQEKAKNKLKTDPLAILGEVNGNPAEIITSAEHSEGILNGGGAYAGLNHISSIRWQEKGFEYLLLGDMTFKQLTKFAEAVSGGKVVIPEQVPSNAKKPQIETTVDMEAEENEQKSVDAGHSPWKLDPAFVTQVYVSLLISPEGIVGDYPIAYEDVIITENTGSDAVAEIHNDKSPAAKVYLKRLIRQDSTGIWTVVGYDPVK